MTDTYQGWPADVVERRARAMLAVFDLYGDGGEFLEALSSFPEKAISELAVATLEADAAAGYVLVPREVNSAFHPMVEAAKSAAMGVGKGTLMSAINAAIAAGARRKEG